MSISIRWQIALAVLLVSILSLAVGSAIALIDSKDRLEDQREAQAHGAEAAAAADLTTAWSRAQGRLMGLEAVLDGATDNATFSREVGELALLDGDLAVVAVMGGGVVQASLPPGVPLDGPYGIATPSADVRARLAPDVVDTILQRASRDLDGGAVVWQAAGDGTAVQGLGGVVVAERPSVTPSDMYRGLASAAGTGFIVAGGTFLGGLVVAGLVLRPLRDLESAMDRVVKGDAGAIQVRGATEFRSFARTMKETAATLAQQRADNEAQMQQLDTEVARRGAALDDRDATLAALFQGISHDVKGPLISATSLMGRMERDISAEERQEILKRCRDSLVRVGHAVDQMVAFSRALREPESKNVAIHDILQACVAQARRAARGMDRHINANGRELWAYCDARRLEVAVTALLDNAFRHGGNVDVTWMAEPQPLITISDNGPGIPYPVEQLVEPYMVRSDTPGAMAGMGLAIAHRMVTGMGGRLDVKTGDEGTHCTIHLPEVQP